MKRYIITVLLICSTMATIAGKDMIIARSEGSITFIVDENLSPVNAPYRRLYTGEDIAERLLSAEQFTNDTWHIVATSFSGEDDLRFVGTDAFYRCIVDAYANHQSVTLTPDMIWLLISQGFTRYVNAHEEELRPLLVSHDGKMDLTIMTDKNLLTEEADWPTLIDGFASQIGEYTKGDIAKTITSDFTTTGSVERVASQITLMESVKSYFEYIVYRVACGIPSITLKGTVNDWQRILEKTEQLRQLGFGEWVNALEPILQQFVQAAKGHPKQAFWKDMVKKKSIKQLKGGGCVSDKPTELDGWLLKLFPDENGKTLDKVIHTRTMPTEYVRVGFKYHIIDPADGHLINETPMELWAGFVGAKVDTVRNMLTPKIGWLVRVRETDDETLDELKKNNDDWGIHLRVKDVPEILSRLGHIKSLHLVFTDSVTLPEWMDKMTIDQLVIEGKMSEEEKEAINQRFPGVFIKTMAR